ncbi:MAG: hypothetical protein IPM46_03785 [Flavobacteriales bacterium]|nr:hypothetical protein [Flavobacteriales bacterium]
MNLTLLPSCRKATELIERGMVKPLGVQQRTGLWFHLRICKGCRAYQAQSAIIERWLEQRRDGTSLPDSTALVSTIISRTVGGAH